MKAKELRKKTKEELENLLKELYEKKASLRFGLSTGKVKNLKEYRTVKKNIARILTILKENSYAKEKVGR